ncbi:MAG: alpha/beta fold hydrolase [Pseudomonadota bacterium]
MSTAWFRLTWAAIIVLGCTHDIATASEAEALVDSGKTEFRSKSCWFELAPEQRDHRRISCGEFVVPEHWDKPSSRSIQLPVVTFHAKDGVPRDDPIVLINGGPGSRPFIRDAASISRSWLPYLQVQPWSSNRDFIVVGLRGTNWTDANLDCPEAADPFSAFGASSEAGKTNRSETLYFENIGLCLERLAKGHDLSGYNSEQAARDIASLRIAMGFDQWNLLGVSYGTYVALKTIRDYPGGIRSVVLDSVTPIDHDWVNKQWADLEQSLERIFEACRGSEVCNRHFPDSREQLEGFLTKAAEEKLEIKIDDHPSYGTIFFPLTPSNTIWMLLFLTYSHPFYMFVPFLIDALNHDHEQDFVAFVAEQSLSFHDQIALGALTIYECNDSYYDMIDVDPHGVEGSYLTTDDSHAEFVSARNALCKRFASSPLPQESYQVAVSDIPALLLSGHFDAVTPPQDAIRAAKSLSRSFQFTFLDRSHSVLTPSLLDSVSSPGCPSRIVTAFLENPQVPPEDPCLENQPELELPWGDVIESWDNADQDGSAELENRLADDWSVARSDPSANKVSVTFRNQTSETLTLYWIDFEGQRKSYGEVDAGREKRQSTFEGHRWELETKSGKLLGRFVATAVDSVAEIHSD